MPLPCFRVARKLVWVVVCAALVLGVGGYRALHRHPADHTLPPGPPVVDPSVAGHDLLRDALNISLDDRLINFAVVPARRPPNLQGLEGVADAGP
jgi:hypothetical protein